MSRHPSVKWAQRSYVLFITFELPDAQDVKVKLEPEGKLFFSATSGADKIPYKVDLDLLDKINADDSKASITSRNIRYIVKKAESKWWSRLLKQTGKAPVFLTVDWDKWVDEDEESGAPPGMDGLDFSSLNLGDYGDFGGAAPDMNDDDSDTEEENGAEASSAEKKEEAPPVSGEHDTN